MLPVSSLTHLSGFSFVFLPLETQTNSAQLIAFSLKHLRAPLSDRFIYTVLFFCFSLITNASLSKVWSLPEPAVMNKS